MNILQRFKQSSLTNQASMVFGAIVMVATAGNIVVALIQLHTAKDLALSSGQQTDKLITAANTNAAASKQFAIAADGIRSGVQDAVAKLNLQAEQLSKTADQTSRLATATVDADRPWVGGTISITRSDDGKQPVIRVEFDNVGKRPALITFAAMSAGLGKVFSYNPDAEYKDATQTTSLLVPGQTMFINAPPLTLTEAQIDQIGDKSLTFYVIAKVEYRDKKTNAEYWTHLCVKYDPVSALAPNCREYNDAK
jgi:hypothetical protein